MYENELYVVIIILLVLMLFKVSSSHLENLANPGVSYVKLYETFRPSDNMVGGSVWEYSSMGGSYLKEALKMNLKSYDINVVNGGVQLWALDSDNEIASSIGLGVSAYDDAYNTPMPALAKIDQTVFRDGATEALYRAVPDKYKLIASVKSGEHVKGTVDYPVKRLMVVIAIDS